MAIRKTQESKTKNLYLIQKVVLARDLKEAIAKEAEGKLVDVCLTNNKHKKLDPAIGFLYSVQGDEADENNDDE